MTFEDLLDQEFTVERLMAGARGARNRATTTWAPIATVRGRLEMSRSLAQKERPQLEEAGTVIPALTVYLAATWAAIPGGRPQPATVTEKDRLTTADGRTLWIDLVAEIGGHHLELQVHEVR